MSELNPVAPASSSPGIAGSELTELKEQCAQLQAQAHNLRLAQLIVALVVAGFFWVEARRNGQTLEAMRPQAAQIAEVTKKQKPAIDDFVNRLVEFGRTHPDFVPILTKHRISTTTAPAKPGVTPAALATPGVQPPAPKK